MEKVKIKLSAIFGVSLFGTLSVIAAIGLVTVGVYAIMEEGIDLSIKTPLWVGGTLFIGGIFTIGIALCGKVSYLKSLILLVISSASFLLCFASLILLEFVEKEKIFLPPKHKYTEPVKSVALWRSTYVIYLVYLISTVVGMVSSVVGFLYIYCILIAPVRNQQWKKYQTQTLGQDQHHGLHHRNKTKYTFKSPPARHRTAKTKMKMKDLKNEFPQSSWIYDTQSIHSLTATPTRVRPTHREIQLKRDVVEELRHNSTFKVNRYQTRPSPTPPRPDPPPPPPITPSALTPAPALPGLAKRNGMDDRQPCTAKSLEPYPIPRKYSLRGSSRRSNYGRQHPSTFRQISPQKEGNAGGEAVNVGGHHDSVAIVSVQELRQQSFQGDFDEHHTTFQGRSAKGPTDHGSFAPCLQGEPIAVQAPQEESTVIRLKPVPVKRRGSKLSSSQHPSATHPGYDQIRSPSSCPSQDSDHIDELCGLSKSPMQHCESIKLHQKPVRHFNGELNGEMKAEAVQEGYAISQGDVWEVNQGLEATADQQAHPLPCKISAYAVQSPVHAMYIQESAGRETEVSEMSQAQVPQLYQASVKDKAKQDVLGQENPKHQGYLMIQNPPMHQDDLTNDLTMQSTRQHSGRTVAPPRPSPKPKLQHQSHVEEIPERLPPEVLQRRSTRKIHARIQAVQEKLWMVDSSRSDNSDHRRKQSPFTIPDEVDHLQPRHAATASVQIDNIPEFCITSTRL